MDGRPLSCPLASGSGIVWVSNLRRRLQTSYVAASLLAAFEKFGAQGHGCTVSGGGGWDVL